MTCRRLWEVGRCPCCGAELGTDWSPGPQDRVVAEGVTLCGHCIERGHDQDDVLPLLLRAIATGEDPAEFG